MQEFRSQVILDVFCKLLLIHMLSFYFLLNNELSREGIRSDHALTSLD